MTVNKNINVNGNTTAIELTKNNKNKDLKFHGEVGTFNSTG